MKFKLIAIPAQDSSLCETFQRLAFTFGYQWSKAGTTVQKVDPIKWLSFDPNSLGIEAAAKNEIDADYVIAKNGTDLLSLFKLPPSKAQVLVNTAKTVTAQLVGNGNVQITNAGKTVVVDNETVKLLADALGFTQKPTVPLVKFEYPESSRNGLPKVRFVRLTSLDDSYLKGYEVDSATSKELGEFKNFVKNRILNGATVEIVKFTL